MNIELGLITKILEDKDFQKVKDKQIKAYYLDKEHRKYFTFIEDFFNANGTVPTVRVFESKFPHLKLETYREQIGTEETLDFWCNKLRDKVTHNTIAKGSDYIADHLENGNVEEAIKSLKKTIAKIDNELVETSAIDITNDAEARKKRYEERKMTQGMIGIPTGIHLLDYILKGFQDKQLITLMASTGVGKTWLWVLIATKMWLEGYRVLFFTTEMSEEQIEDRIEAMAMGLLYGNFNYNHYKSGKLDPETEKKYFEFLERKEHMETLIIETATDVSNVASKLEQYEADIVFIDSTYLMEDDQRSDADWMRVTNIFRGLKKLAKRTGTPICANTQQDLNKKGGGLGSINFARAITHESDVVIALERDEEMIEDHEAKIRVLKQREGTLGNVYLKWDFRVMNFDPIYSTDATGNTLDNNRDSIEPNRNMINLEDVE